MAKLRVQRKSRRKLTNITNVELTPENISLPTDSFIDSHFMESQEPEEVNPFESVSVPAVVKDAEKEFGELDNVLNADSLSNDEKLAAINEFLKNNGRVPPAPSAGFWTYIQDGLNILARTSGLGDNSRAGFYKILQTLAYIALFPFAQATMLRLFAEANHDKNSYTGYRNFLRMVNTNESLHAFLSALCFVGGIVIPLIVTAIILLRTAVGGSVSPEFIILSVVYWLSQLTSLVYETGRYNKLHVGDK